MRRIIDDGGSMSAPRRSRAHLWWVVAAFVMILAVIASAAGPTLFPLHEPPNARKAEAWERPPATPAPSVGDEGFVHPGIYVSKAQLDFVKAKIDAELEPWRTLFDAARSSEAARAAPDFTQFADADDTSSACEPGKSSGCVTYCGANRKPDVGCSQENADALGAYTQALLWYFSGNETYAKRAVTILNAYAAHLVGHEGYNAPLQAGWTAQILVRAAEIIRYTYTAPDGDSVFDVEGFADMLESVFVPVLSTYDYSHYNGNWILSAADGLMNTAVFLDDRELYEQSVSVWRDTVPGYVYLDSDGPMPLDVADVFTSAELACRWIDNRPSSCQSREKSTFSDMDFIYQHGQAQETCRDFIHVSMGLGSLINTAETAHIQGDALYEEEQDRIMAGVLYSVQVHESFSEHGYPEDFCGGLEGLPAWPAQMPNLGAAVVYNAYAVREGVAFQAIAIPGYPKPRSSDDPLADYIAGLDPLAPQPVHISPWSALTHHLVGDGEAWD